MFPDTGGDGPGKGDERWEKTARLASQDFAFASGVTKSPPIGRSGFAAGWGERAAWVVQPGRGWPSKDSDVVMPWGSRPLWLGLLGTPHERVSRCQNSETA